MVGATAEDQDKGEQDYTDNGNDLERGQPEFKLAEEPDTEVVDADDGDEEDGNKDTRVDSVTIDPILNDEGSSCQLIGGDDDVFEPVSSRVSWLWLGTWSRMCTYVQPRAKPRDGSQKREA